MPDLGLGDSWVRVPDKRLMDVKLKSKKHKTFLNEVHLDFR